MPDPLKDRPAQFASGFNLQLPGFILSRFRVLISTVFESKDNYCPPDKPNSVQLPRWRQVSNRFCLISRFCPVFFRFLSAAVRQNICPLRPKFFKCDKPSAPVTVLVITSGKVHGGSVYVLPPTPKKLPQKRRKIYFIQGVVLLYCISEIPFVQPPSTIRKEISGTFFWRVGADVNGPI